MRYVLTGPSFDPQKPGERVYGTVELRGEVKPIDFAQALQRGLLSYRAPEDAAPAQAGAAGSNGNGGRGGK